MDKEEDEQSSPFNLEKLFEKTDKQIKEKVSGSVLDPPKEGNYALFRNAKFHLKGDFQINSVFYSERDVNGYNGNDKKWDSVKELDVRTQTNEVEAFMYHDLTLKPVIEFNDGMVFLHMSLYHGGFMYEMDYPNVVYDNKSPTKDFLQSRLDYQKLIVESVFLEMITPAGIIAAGIFPDEILGINLNGLIYGIGLPKYPNQTFAFAYGIKSEGYNKYAFEHPEGIYYTDTQNDDNYQDKDDQTVFAFLLMYDNKDTLKGKIQLARARGGSGSPTYEDLRVNSLSGELDYHKDKLKIYARYDIRQGPIVPFTKNDEGKILKQIPDIFNTVLAQVDANGEQYRTLNFNVEDLEIPFGISFFAMASYDMGRYTPEAGFLYTSGGSKWYEANHFMDRSFEPEGNRTPRPYMKAYLLNEIEDKYHPLISNFATYVMPRDTEVMSYQNMTAFKIGTKYRISEHFELFTQALAAWRSNVKYYEEDYWDVFMLSYFYFNLRSYSAPDGTKRTLVPALVSLQNVDYHQKVDPFLGMEFNGKLTWFARQGLEISLIGAYFKTGGFYEDLLTPKKYLLQKATIDENVNVQLVGNPSIFYGPNESTNTYKPTDAWTAQLKFDFKFQ